MSENRNFDEQRKHHIYTDISDRDLINAAPFLLPQFIKTHWSALTVTSMRVYRLEVNGLMAGGYRISYVNCKYEPSERILFDDISDDPLDCIKFIRHQLYQSLLSYERATEEEYKIASSSHCDKKDSYESIK